MNIYEVTWRNKFIEKLAAKHNVSTEEVEEVLFGSPLIRRWAKGNTAGEDLYLAYGQTDAGRYLVVFFILKPQNTAPADFGARYDPFRKEILQ